MTTTKTIRVSRQYPPPDLVIRSIGAATTRYSARVEIYEQDGTTRWAYDDTSRLIDGSVTVDYSRDERRSFSMTLDNTDNILVSAPGYFWYDKVIKVYRQIRIRAGSYDAWEFQLGEFMIDSIDEAHFPHRVNIQGRDYAKKLMLSKFTTTTQFSGTYTLEYLVNIIATNGGISKMILPTTGITVTNLTANRGDTRWDTLKKIATDNNYDVYFDNRGYLRLAPQPDPFTQDPVFVFKTGAASNLASYAKSTDDSQLYNHVLVTGKDTTGLSLPPWAEAINADPESPTSTVEIGDRLWEWDSDTITYRFNYSPNPSAETNSTTFGASPGTGGAATLSRITSSTLGFADGSAKMRATFTTSPTASGGIYQLTNKDSVAAGEVVSASCQILTSIAQRVQLLIAFYDSKDVFISQAVATPVVTAATQWTYFKLENATAPAKANKFRVQVSATTGTGYVNWPVNSFIEMDAVLIEKSAIIGPYFDGSKASCFWTGTANNSTSISNQQAQSVADAFLKIHALEQYQISLNALNHFYLDVGQVVEFDDPRPAPGDPTRFLLQSLTIPIKLGTMSATAGRITIVGSS